MFSVETFRLSPRIEASRISHFNIAILMMPNSPTVGYVSEGSATLTLRVCVCVHKRTINGLREIHTTRAAKEFRELTRGRNDKRAIRFRDTKRDRFYVAGVIVCVRQRAQCNDLMHIYRVLIVPIKNDKKRVKEGRREDRTKNAEKAKEAVGERP